MKSKRLLLLLPAAAIASVVLAQGPLTPPGAPAPAMMSLDQIEPRTPISSLPFIISQSGSYYLTRNFQATPADGVPISIQASNVTLDLNGFTLSSTAAAFGPAIEIGSEAVHYRWIRITNGTIKGTTAIVINGFFPNRTWTATPGGFSTGIGANSSSCEFSHLTVTGCRASGLIVGRKSRIHHVTTEENGLSGIRALDAYARCDLHHCISGRNVGVGIFVGGSVITSCTAEDNSAGGIVANNGCVSSCVATDNGGTGIDANNGSAHHCISQSNAVYGINGSGGSVAFCNVNGNATAGIFGASITRTGNYPAP